MARSFVTGHRNFAAVHDTLFLFAGPAGESTSSDWVWTKCRLDIRFIILLARFLKEAGDDLFLIVLCGFRPGCLTLHSGIALSNDSSAFGEHFLGFVNWVSARYHGYIDRRIAPFFSWILSRCYQTFPWVTRVWSCRRQLPSRPRKTGPLAWSRQCLA